MKIKVGIFFGGVSVEHEVSIISAVQAMTNIDREKYDPVPVYISKEGEMYHGGDLSNINLYRNTGALLKNCKKVTLIKNGNKFLLVELKKSLFKKPITEIDIAFPIFHGTNCEDGSIAGLFETLGIPYVGCDVLSSAAGMDKAVFKNILTAHGIPVLDSFVFSARQWVRDSEEIIKEIEKKFAYPVIIKPVNLGSSVGISRVDNANALINAAHTAASFSPRILVETAVKNLREFNCSVIGDAETNETSVIEEPVLSGEMLSYSDKYENGGKNKGMTSLKRKIPADIPNELVEKIEEYSKNTFTALGCNGVVRIDFLYDTDNDELWVNEINTIPGSLSFYLWEPKGVPYRKLLDRLISLGFKRAREKANIMYTYDTNILSGGGSFSGKK